MKPIDQTIMTPPNGNCVAACVASILELPLEEVPNFIESDDFWDDLNNWLVAKSGLYLVCIPPDWTPHGYHIIDGKSKSGPWNHVVVGLDGEMVHDPNPKRRGIEGDPEWYWVFATKDPAKCEAVRAKRRGQEGNRTQILPYSTVGDTHHPETHE